MFEIPLFYDKSKKVRLPKFFAYDLEKSLNRMLNKKELDYLKGHFNNFYNTLIKNSLDNRNQDILEEYREFVEQLFYVEFKNFINANETYRECVQNNILLIDLYIHQRFFFANLTFKGLATTFDDMIGISKKGNRFTKSLSNHDLILYSEVWEIVENQFRKNIKESCKKVAFNHPEETDELLEKLHKRFYEYMRRYKIKTPKDWKKYITNFT